MPVYFTCGKALLLHVPIESPLTHEEKYHIENILERSGLKPPTQWNDINDYNVDAGYHEVLESYILENQTSTVPLHEKFEVHEPVESYIHILENHSLNSKLQGIRSDIALAYCNVGYVSILV